MAQAFSLFIWTDDDYCDDSWYMYDGIELVTAVDSMIGDVVGEFFAIRVA